MDTISNNKPGKERLHFEIGINADVDRVYKMMLDKEGYKGWTAEFNPTSSYKGSWDKGSKILFIGTDADGNEGGMVSFIEEHIPGKFVSIRHEGIIKDGQEITSGAEVDEWAGGHENYTFHEDTGKTIVSVDIDTVASFKQYMLDTYPRALRKLKEMCEQ